MKDIKIYTKEHCPYCSSLKNFLSKKGYKFENISVDGDDKLYSELKASTNHHTVPQVFVGNNFIGGSEDFLNYVRNLEKKERVNEEV